MPSIVARFSDPFRGIETASVHIDNPNVMVLRTTYTLRVMRILVDWEVPSVAHGLSAYKDMILIYVKNPPYTFLDRNKYEVFMLVCGLSRGDVKFEMPFTMESPYESRNVEYRAEIFQRISSRMPPTRQESATACIRQILGTLKYRHKTDADYVHEIDILKRYLIRMRRTHFILFTNGAFVKLPRRGNQDKLAIFRSIAKTVVPELTPGMAIDFETYHKIIRLKADEEKYEQIPF